MKILLIQPPVEDFYQTSLRTLPVGLLYLAASLRCAGIDVEILDLRTLNPYDWDAIATSIRKTSRVIVAHEDMLSWGYGAEIAARIADELFDELDAPVKRVAAMDTFCAYQPKLEDVILPQTEHITAAVKQLLEY